MRQVLVESLRKHKAEKRGGGRVNVTLDHFKEVSDAPDVDILAIHQALERLAIISTSSRRRIVELRFFGGLSIEEAAETLGVGTRHRSSVSGTWREHGSVMQLKVITLQYILLSKTSRESLRAITDVLRM